MLGLGGHPFTGQVAAPSGGHARRLAELAEFLAQRAHFRDAVQADQLAPFSGRFVAQRLQRTHPHQRHERQHQKDRFQRIKSFGQLKEFTAVAQQALGEQSGQRPQHARQRHVGGAFELHGRLPPHAHRRQQAFCAARGGAAQRGGLIFRAPLALGADQGAGGRIFFFAPARKRPNRIAL